MPIYQYHCDKCGLEFEEQYKIAERETPCTLTPHPECLYERTTECNILLVPQLPSMISMRDGWRRHTDEGWKDTLRKIRDESPGSQLDV